MPPSKVSVVILQFNNSEDTIRCLESVKELDYDNLEVIVVDNASKVKHFNAVRFFVESQEKIGETRFKLITSRSNLGYAGGNNIGTKYALENSADYVLILNPDTTVKSNLLTKLVETAKKNPKAGIIGTAINEGDRIVYCGEIKWLKPELEHLTQKPLPRRQAGKTRNLKPDFYIPGVAMLISKRVFEKIGFLDEKYFLYFEDADYSLRAKKAGYNLGIEKKTMVYHQASASTSSLGAPLLLRYHYRNAHLFNAKNAPLWARILLPFWSIWIIIKQAIKILFNVKPKISHAILNGVLDFYRGRFGKLKM